MLPGPDQVIACPMCQTLARYGTLLSGNTIGARTWTDGKQVAPMLPHPPAVVRCGQCKEVYWLAEAHEIGEVDRWSGEDPANPAWSAAPEVEEPEEQEYYRALDQGLASNSEEERTLRVLAWWRGNDPEREGADAPAPRAQEAAARWKANLEALIGLVDEDDDGDRLMKAELFRQLGEFDRATAMLDRVSSPSVAGVVRQFRSLCEARDMRVRELRFRSE